MARVFDYETGDITRPFVWFVVIAAVMVKTHRLNTDRSRLQRAESRESARGALAAMVRGGFLGLFVLDLDIHPIIKYNLKPLSCPYSV